LAKSEKSDKFQFFRGELSARADFIGDYGRRFRDPFVIQKSAIFDGF